MISIDTDTMKNFGKAMEKLGDMGVDGLVDAFNGAYDKVNDSIPVSYTHLDVYKRQVQGRDYINPAIQPVFDRILQDRWKEVTR